MKTKTNFAYFLKSVFSALFVIGSITFLFVMVEQAQPNNEPIKLDQTPVGEPLEQKNPDGKGSKKIYKNKDNQIIKEEEYNDLHFLVKTKYFIQIYPNNKDNIVQIDYFGVSGKVKSEYFEKANDKTNTTLYTKTQSNFYPNGKPTTETITMDDYTKTSSLNQNGKPQNVTETNGGKTTVWVFKDGRPQTITVTENGKTEVWNFKDGDLQTKTITENGKTTKKEDFNQDEEPGTVTETENGKTTVTKNKDGKPLTKTVTENGKTENYEWNENDKGWDVKTTTEQPKLKEGPPSVPHSEFNLPGYQVDPASYNGIESYTFSTPNGKIEVNLPDEFAPGDTITVTLNIIPSGKTKEELAKNEAEIKKLLIELPGNQLAKISEKLFTFLVPQQPTKENCHLALVKNNKPVSTTTVSPEAKYPPQENFSLPTGGQQGKYLVLKGPYNGLIENSDFVKIGEKPMPIIAESPRQRVVLNNSEQIGLTEIVSNEGGKSSECPFRNIGIKLSADSLNLLRGQTTSLHIQVSGLSGISNEVPLTIINNSPTVISISGGNHQLIKINPEMVNVDGTFNINQTLTGIVPGSFGITGTVTWLENCGNS